jgi:hypothetical protein
MGMTRFHRYHFVAGQTIGPASLEVGADGDSAMDEGGGKQPECPPLYSADSRSGNNFLPVPGLISGNWLQIGPVRVVCR